MNTIVMWTLIAAASMIGILVGLVVLITTKTRLNNEQAEIVRRRIEEQQAIFRRADIEIYNKRERANTISQEELDRCNVEARFGISA